MATTGKDEARGKVKLRDIGQHLRKKMDINSQWAARVIARTNSSWTDPELACQLYNGVVLEKGK